jgi:hypothetical protein
LSLTEYQAENLKLDAKTLADISRVLEMDGRFKVVPGILDGIASDILEVFKIEPEQKLDEILGHFDRT